MSVSIHGQWSSRLAFILAAAGSAVGLGNIWKFPYLAGENGGGAFVIVYLICVAMIGIPLMMAEVLMGRRGRQSPIHSFRDLAIESGRTRWWWLAGLLGVLAGVFILSFYSVIAGWALHYVGHAAMGAFNGADAKTIEGMFAGLLASPNTLLMWHSLFMIVTILIVAGGVEAGIERAAKWLLPALFVLLLVMIGYGATTGYLGRAVSFLFEPDFSKLSPDMVLAAMGQAFFSLSLGMGAIMAYGAYLPKDTSIARTSAAVVGMDTMVAIVAGLAIFPIVFANGMEPGAGPGLVFVTLPIAFGQMAGGTMLALLFFLLLVLAALTSAISLLEPTVAWLVERGIKRPMAALAAGATIWLVGLGTVWSFNHWSEVKLFGRTVFDTLDGLTSNIMLPLGGLLIATFVSRVMRRDLVSDELQINDGFGYRLWRFLVRYVVRIAIFLVFLNAVGAIDYIEGLLSGLGLFEG